MVPHRGIEPRQCRGVNAMPSHLARGAVNWSARVDLNHRPPGSEPGALTRLSHAQKMVLSLKFQSHSLHFQQGFGITADIIARIMGMPGNP